MGFDVVRCPPLARHTSCIMCDAASSSRIGKLCFVSCEAISCVLVCQLGRRACMVGCCCCPLASACQAKHRGDYQHERTDTDAAKHVLRQLGCSPANPSSMHAHAAARCSDVGCSRATAQALHHMASSQPIAAPVTAESPADRPTVRPTQCGGPL